MVANTAVLKTNPGSCFARAEGGCRALGGPTRLCRAPRGCDSPGSTWTPLGTMAPRCCRSCLPSRARGCSFPKRTRSFASIRRGVLSVLGCYWCCLGIARPAAVRGTSPFLAQERLRQPQGRGAELLQSCCCCFLGQDEGEVYSGDRARGAGPWK